MKLSCYYWHLIFLFLCTQNQKLFVRSDEAHEMKSVLETKANLNDYYTSICFFILTRWFICFSALENTGCPSQIQLYLSLRVCVSNQWPLWVLLPHWASDELDWYMPEIAEGASGQMAFLLIISQDVLFCFFSCLCCSFNTKYNRENLFWA